VAKLEKVRQPLGKLISRKEISAQQTTTLPGMPDGTYFVAQYDTSFGGLTSAVETVTFTREKNGQWRAAAYLIRPRTEAEKTAISAAQTWLAAIDDGHYAESWTSAADYFQKAITQDKWVSAVEACRNPLAKPPPVCRARLTDNMWSCSSRPRSRTKKPRWKLSRSCWKKMANGGRRGITSIDLNNQCHQPSNQYERSTACLVCHRDHPPGDLGWSVEADCPVEECAPQPIGVVHLPRHLQHGRHFAHSLHSLFPENRTAAIATGAKNLSHLAR
jgi:hypothetical protein